MSEEPFDDVAAIVIGRNEGSRLLLCLRSLKNRVKQVVYVDSGSTDGSVAAALAEGAQVVELDLDRPFTAARARNAGRARLGDTDQFRFVQFVDADCEVQPGWLSTARAFLLRREDVAAVGGRRRERFPDATLWNRLTDEEWGKDDAGSTKACGGDAMIRLSAFDEVGGFNPGLIAGEEPELCVRLRAKGWTIWRLPEDMTLHDADMTRFSQWWQRAKRAGYTYAEGVAMHGRAPERHNVDRLKRTLLWGLALPLAILLAIVFISPWAALLLLIWPVQILRLSRRGARPSSAAFLMLAKFAEVHGAATWLWRRLRGQDSRLIEYK